MEKFEDASPEDASDATESQGMLEATRGWKKQETARNRFFPRASGGYISLPKL